MLRQWWRSLPTEDQFADRHPFLYYSLAAMVLVAGVAVCGAVIGIIGGLLK